VHAAHGLADRFPDGQLFADLHGVSAQPVGPMQVLEWFLRALGVPGAQIPEGPDERAEEFRSLLAGRKILVVLDDAASERQVLPLLPGSNAAAVLITSRARLAGVAGAIRLDLDVFDVGSCLDLLARIIGVERLQAQPDAAAEVARYCGQLPLALRIAGARLSARPHWSIRQLAGRLADEARRLDELRHGDLAVRVSISLSYESASKQARRLLRRLALLDVPVFSGWLSAALLGQPPAEADDVLDELVSAQLVEVIGNETAVPGQYRLHELIRMFARERLAAEEQAADRQAALLRALGALLYLADEANRRYYGGSFVELHSNTPRWPLPERLVGDPAAWFERERASLVSGVRQAARAGSAELCWRLAFCAVPLFEHGAYFDDWRETADIALEAARKAQDVRGQAAILFSTGLLHTVQGMGGRAMRDLEAAARLFEDAADENGVAMVTRHIAFLYRLSGRLDDAARRYEQVLAIFRTTGQHVAAAYALLNMALIKLELHGFAEARELLADAVRLGQAGRSAPAEEIGHDPAGEACLPAGEPAYAAAVFEQALAMVRTMGDPVGEAYILLGAGDAKLRQGEFGPARSALERAREIASALGHSGAEARALLALAELALASGDPRQAITLGQQAAAAFREMGMPLIHARALGLLSDAHAVLGNGAAAAAALAEATALRAATQVTRQGPDA
jgi:tetratricopeptide (TPR) repeat protein